jgi:predicted aspartyl protease
MHRTRLSIVAALICAAFALSAPTIASDDYTPSDLTAAQILAKSATAHGKLEPGAYAVLSHAHGGGADYTYVSHINGDDATTVESGGSFVSSYGRFQGQSWSQDENGTVILESGFVENGDPNAVAMKNPGDPDSRVKALGITKEPKREYVIEVNPPGGEDEYRYYDAQTMLLDRLITFESDRHEHVTTYDDYRTAFGQTSAYHWHYDDGRTNNVTDTWVSSFVRDANPAPLAIPTPNPRYTLPVGTAVTLPARFTSSGIIVRATIAGRGLDFKLDTGASSITIDPGVAHDLQLQTFGTFTGTIGGELDESETKIADMQIGPLSLKDVAASVIPLSENTDDSRIVGLLGCDFIAGSVVGIDFGQKTVTLYPSAGFNPFAVGATVRRSIDVDDCLPRIAGSVESVPGSFLIDTGAFTTVLYKNYIRKLPQSHIGGDADIRGIMAVGGAVHTQEVMVSDLVLGPVQFKSAEVTEPLTSTFDIRDYDGIFGRNALSPFAIYLDYTNRVVYFKLEKNH